VATDPASQSLPASPFRGTSGAFAYVVLLVILLLSPLWLHLLGAPSPRDRYREMSYQTGDFPYIEQQVFDEEGDIDMLILGASYAWTGIDAPYLQDRLSRALSRPAVVRNFGTNFRSEDMYYALLRDVLRRRRVKMVVFQPPAADLNRDVPHPYAHRFFPYFDDPALTAGLPRLNKVELWAENVLGAPRHLLSLLRNNPPDLQGAAPFIATFGALLTRSRYDGGSFVRQERVPPPIPVESMIYGPASRDRFRFANVPLLPYSGHFIRLLGELVRQHGTKMVLLHMPHYGERRDEVVNERLFWPGLFDGATLMGVPSALLFRDMSDDQLVHYFGDSHLNANGARLFTATVSPALIKVYEDNR
jgi:hypothetical protein